MTATKEKKPKAEKPAEPKPKPETQAAPAKESKPPRVILVRCQFNKPSAALSQGDDGENFVKMSAVIPDSDINRAQLAEEFFHKKQLKIQFSRRGHDKWDNQLPEMEESLPEIIECQTDVQSYNRQTSGYKISWLLSHDLLDYDSAFCEYAGAQGSLRITLIGDMQKKAKKEKSTAETVAAARPLAGQKSLLDEGEPGAVGTKLAAMDRTSLTVEGEFNCPDEFMVPSHVDGASTLILVGEHGKKFFASGETLFRDTSNMPLSSNWGQPKKSDSGFASVTLAVQAMLGSILQHQIERQASDKCVADLRAELKRLEDGGEPIPMSDLVLLRETCPEGENNYYVEE